MSLEVLGEFFGGFLEVGEGFLGLEKGEQAFSYA
jgi:hypothetical protein